MKKLLIGIVGVGALTIGWLFSTTYNEMAPEDQKVAKSYAQVQIVLARQAELIPNMAEVARGYAQHEETTFKEIAEARSAMSAAASIKPEDLAKDPELQKKLVEAQAASSQAFMKINAVREAYPQLQANENFKTLMVELAGSQNRIAVERRRNQQAVADYNMLVVKFPKNLVAKVIGLGEKPYFAAAADQQHAPKLDFSKK